MGFLCINSLSTETSTYSISSERQDKTEMDHSTSMREAEGEDSNYILKETHGEKITWDRAYSWGSDMKECSWFYWKADRVRSGAAVLHTPAASCVLL